MKAEDKAKIMETLGTLTKSITKLQEEIKGISSSSNPLQGTKSKAQVGLKPGRSHTCVVDAADLGLYLASRCFPTMICAVVLASRL